MNKRERFQNFLQNKPVDRVPVAFWHHFIQKSEFGSTGMEDDAIFEKNIIGHRKSKERFNPDLVKVMNDSLLVMPVDTSFVEKAADLRKIEPISMTGKYVTRCMELTSRVREFYDSDTPVYVTAFSPLYHLRCSLYGGFNNMAAAVTNGVPDTRFMRLFREDPEAVACALDVIGQSVAELNRKLMLECGAEGVYFSTNNRARFLPDDLFTKYIAPSEKKILIEANKCHNSNLLHICGQLGLENNLMLFTEYDAAAINFAIYAEKVSLSEGKKIFGGKPIIGGFNNAPKSLLHSGTKEEIEAYTYQILDEVGQTGFMIGADCTVPADIDEHRFEWVRQAAIHYASR